LRSAGLLSHSPARDTPAEHGVSLPSHPVLVVWDRAALRRRLKETSTEQVFRTFTAETAWQLGNALRDRILRLPNGQVWDRAALRRRLKHHVERDSPAERNGDQGRFALSVREAEDSVP
jgi:hypothetical protein